MPKKANYATIKKSREVSRPCQGTGPWCGGAKGMNPGPCSIVSAHQLKYSEDSCGSNAYRSGSAIMANGEKSSGDFLAEIYAIYSFHIPRWTFSVPFMQKNWCSSPIWSVTGHAGQRQTFFIRVHELSRVRQNSSSFFFFAQES